MAESSEDQHRIDISGGSDWKWSCSCGRRGKPGTRSTYRQAKAASDRHLRAARKRGAGSVPR